MKLQFTSIFVMTSMASPAFAHEDGHFHFHWLPAAILFAVLVATLVASEMNCLKKVKITKAD